MLFDMPAVALLALLLSVSEGGAASPQAPTSGPAAPAPPPARFGPEWTALIGEWKGVGSGATGEGGGTASFRFDLEGRILVRRNTSDYPAAGGRSPIHHEDLMILYPDGSASGVRAIYFDNEGHVIEYAASWSENAKRLTFLSDPRAPGPRFRLVYDVLGPARLSVDFDIAPPGTETFRTYVRGAIERVRP